VSELVIQTEIQRGRAVKIIQALSLEKPWRMVVEPHHNRRTTSQNARLWALHQKVAQHLGVAPDDMHEESCCRFFGYEEKKIGAFIRRIPIERSRYQDTKRFREFMDATEHWYIEEFGIWLE